MDKRKTYYCILDTETCPINNNIKEVKASNMLVYNIGYRIIDKQGNCYLEKSYIVNEVFFGEYKKMLNAYYVNKLPLYFSMLGDGTIQRESILIIMREFKLILREFNCKIVSMHNAYFDFTALKTTMDYLFPLCYIDFFPKDIIIWDTMKMARDTICKNKTYNYLTPTGRKSATAENLYKYISLDNDFKESHTALEDTKIESEILIKCLSHHKRMNKELFPKRE